MVNDNQAEIVLAGRLDGQQRTRLTKLLDMMYTPAELAKEVGFTVRQVYRVYLPAGCPHERDKERHIWINGKTFREWANEQYKKRKLGKDETFCMTCKRPVKIVNPVEAQQGRLKYVLSSCPNCGRKLTRIIEKKKRQI